MFWMWNCFSEGRRSIHVNNFEPLTNIYLHRDMPFFIVIIVIYSLHQKKKIVIYSN